VFSFLFNCPVHENEIRVYSVIAVAEDHLFSYKGHDSIAQGHGLSPVVSRHFLDHGSVSFTKHKILLPIEQTSFLFLFNSKVPQECPTTEVDEKRKEKRKRAREERR
jgi:hypothetical protein